MHSGLIVSQANAYQLRAFAACPQAIEDTGYDAVVEPTAAAKPNVGEVRFTQLHGIHSTAIFSTTHSSMICTSKECHFTSVAMQAEVKLAIEGMTCASCVANVERVMQGVPGILSCTVNLMTGVCVFVWPKRCRLCDSALCRSLGTAFRESFMLSHYTLS